jgi:UDP-N-acetylmuramoylalanine--D-glutamate ligase
MRMHDLQHARVAIWGYGREGRAALAALRRRFSRKALTLFCSEVEARLANDRAGGLAVAPLQIATSAPDVDALCRFDIIIKSPGISAYQSPVPQAQAAGVRFTSGTALWFAENPGARVIGVTGTKGKSTTSALIAHLGRALGKRTALAGNIGLPLLDLEGQQADLWVVELSSFQTGEAGPLDVGVIANVYEEHLDWHGSRERYVADKLKIAAVSRTLVVNALQPDLLARTAAHPRRACFGDPLGWHLREDAIWRGEERVLQLHEVPLPGAHNAQNVCAALAALQAMGLDAHAAARHVAGFKPLPHRLQALGCKNGLEYVNDSIATTPYATVEALRSLRGRQVSVIVGGFDRGVDWSAFVQHVAVDLPRAIVVTGANGGRIAEALRAIDIAPCQCVAAPTLAQAVQQAQSHTPAGGVVLLSPGAPSFDQFTDYAERGREFARLAGFDPAAIAQIDGLGIR